MPFQSFRLFLTDGAVYDVRHPEMILLGKRSMVLGLSKDPNQPLYERTVDIDLLHIVRLENLEVAAKPNGAP